MHAVRIEDDGLAKSAEADKCAIIGRKKLSQKAEEWSCIPQRHVKIRRKRKEEESFEGWEEARKGLIEKNNAQELKE